MNQIMKSQKKVRDAVRKMRTFTYEEILAGLQILLKEDMRATEGKMYSRTLKLSKGIEKLEFQARVVDLSFQQREDQAMDEFRQYR